MLRLGFKPTIAVFERTKAFCALARAATVIDIIQFKLLNGSEKDIHEYFKFRQIRTNKKIESHMVNKKKRSNSGGI
jgi:hypothetical protein